MRTNNKMIIKHIVPVTTTFGCYADDLWIIPLQINRTQTPDVYENGFVDNHGQPYIEIFHFGFLKSLNFPRNWKKSRISLWT